MATSSSLITIDGQTYEWMDGWIDGRLRVVGWIDKTIFKNKTNLLDVTIPNRLFQTIP
jgi:hypothetical protein